jgi:hypothetical protein
MPVLLSLMISLFFRLETPQSEIPKNGTYTYEITFAEWEGKTMGDEIIVVLHDGHITLKLSENCNVVWIGLEPGDIIEEGLLRQHKSGVWIISNDEKDIYLEEIGGCSGGPTLVNFEKKTIEIC